MKTLNVLLYLVRLSEHLTKRKKIKPNSKKIKTDKTKNEPVSIIKLLRPANDGSYPISFANLRLLIDIVRSYVDPIEIITQIYV